MTWQIFVRDAAESDLDRLNEGDQRILASAMFAWVEHGPPRQTRRDVLGAAMFDDSVAEAFRVTYVVDDEQRRVFVVHFRRALRRE